MSTSATWLIEIPLGNLQDGYGLADNPGDLNDESLFLNLTKGGYWSGIPYGPNPNAEAWYFVMDLGLPGMSGIEGIRCLRECYPKSFLCVGGS